MTANGAIIVLCREKRSVLTDHGHNGVPALFFGAQQVLFQRFYSTAVEFEIQCIVRFCSKKRAKLIAGWSNFGIMLKEVRGLVSDRYFRHQEGVFSGARKMVCAAERSRISTVTQQRLIKAAELVVAVFFGLATIQTRENSH